ncbi:MAG: MalY/PatB family protein [Nitrososphaeria archaeon]
MKYNFDIVVNRKGTNSYKWDYIKTKFGADDIIPMWVADMDFLSPKPVIHAIKNRAKHGIYGYTIRPNSYYQSVVNWLKIRHKWEVKPQWIEYSPGVVSSINIAIQTFTKPGDKIIVQPPVYYPFFDAVKGNRRRLVTNSLIYEDGRYLMDFEDLEDKFDSKVRMLVLCSPHNPVGRVWTRDELSRLGEICCKNNAIIVSDEIHSDLTLKGYRHVPTASISPEIADITLTTIAPSKTFNLAGLNNSTVISSNKKMLQRFKEAVESAGLGLANVFGIVASEAAYTYGQEWLEQLLEYIEGNVSFLTEYIKERIPEIRLVKPEGTYLVWLDCRGLNLNPRSLNEFMIKKARVGLLEGSIFGEGGEGFLRMNIACPRTILREALTRIENAVKDIRPDAS